MRYPDPPLWNNAFFLVSDLLSTGLFFKVTVTPCNTNEDSSSDSFFRPDALLSDTAHSCLLPVLLLLTSHIRVFDYSFRWLFFYDAAGSKVGLISQVFPDNIFFNASFIIVLVLP